MGRFCGARADKGAVWAGTKQGVKAASKARVKRRFWVCMVFLFAPIQIKSTNQHEGKVYTARSCILRDGGV
jgi:hypothetical protein